MDLTADDLPLLDEPLPVELANTRYGDPPDGLDFLADDLAPLWLGAGPLAGRGPHVWGPAELARLRRLRDAVWEVLFAGATGSGVPRVALDRIDRDARSASRPLVCPDGRPLLGLQLPPDPERAVRAELAHAARDLIVGSAWTALRVCAATDCPMLFVQQHHRRRFCNPSCSHRTRQAAWYRRQRG